MRNLVLGAVVALSSLPLFAVESPEYRALRAARPDGRTVAVKNLTLARNEFRLTFNGTFHLLAPANDRTFGAVFVGTGTYELRPASETERRHLVYVTATKDLEIFTDSFEKMVLLFADSTAEEISKGSAIVNGAPDPRAVTIYDEYLSEQKRRYQVNLHLRVLQDLLNGKQGKGVFLATVDSAKHEPVLLVTDPAGISALAARFADLSGEETALLSFDNNNGGLWYLGSPADKRARGSAPRMLVDATRYVIDTTIESKLEIKASTAIHFETKVAALRVLPLNILPKLRLRSATFAAEGAEPVEVALVQEEIDLGKLARLFREEVADADAAVVFPAPLAAGTRGVLRLEYDGREVLREVGPDSYSVRARESWYPNTGTFIDTALYELTYRFPKRNNLISTGKLVSESEESGRKTAVWKSEQPMRVAGFNFGRFDKTTRLDEPSGTQIDVYTTGDRKKFANDSLADAMNTARLGTVFFGKPPYTPVSVTQQAEWFFGQSWPSLIYLPTLALTSSTERVFMFEDAGPEVFGLNEFAKMVGWHEFAHQWWGHAVGWQSYRDQWLSEGFAEFTSALVINATESFDKYNDYWERRRREILQKNRGASIAPNDTGPISQGFRLSTRYAPGAYQTVIYSKGAYVVHMLRMMLRDSRSKNPDERFVKLMHEFVSAYSGKSPSTADFQKIVEKHMTKAMDAGNDGKMDWFFNQWVYGNEVPRFKSTVVASDAGSGKIRLAGAVSQEGVSSSFVSIVPLYADLGKEGVFQIGAIRLVGTTSQPLDMQVPMPKVPKRIMVNAFHDVLARD
ncbi:MAG: hypothetical protein JJE51_04490 [Thermoanaerobaculia bacterium]|nr:hypothetical protein [Thermoanaerobaculia bacterium]